MNRAMRITGMVVAAMLTGWIVGHAQTTNPDFELLVNAPGGETSIQCLRGCDLSWIERGLNPRSGVMTKFTFSCGASECSSGRIGGWLRR
jgi:hypothetical protein